MKYGRRSSPTATLAPFILAVASTFMFAAQQPAMAAASPSPSDTSPTVQLKTSSNKAEGVLAVEDATVRVSATSVTSSRDAVAITVNGKTIDFTRDDSTGLITRNGHGHTIEQADLSALGELASDLSDQYVEGAQTGRAGADHVDLLVRSVAFLAAAPAGIKLDARAIPKPRMRVATAATLAEREAAAEVKAECAQRASAAATKEGVVAATAAACQQTDEDGILYMSCTRAKRSMYYDAQNRCWSRDYVDSGKGSSGSLGECGPADNGIDTFTYDCGEHDRCGRVYGGSFNPWDKNCGDEFFEAEDDFLNAPINRC